MSWAPCEVNFSGLQCGQAASDRSKAAEATAPKRPSFRRPTAKRPAAAAPADEQAAAQISKKPRLDSLFQQSTAQPSRLHERGNINGSDAHQVWSPTQHTDLPYSPGEPRSDKLCACLPAAQCFKGLHQKAKCIAHKTYFKCRLQRHYDRNYKARPFVSLWLLVASMGFLPSSGCTEPVTRHLKHIALHQLTA